MSEETVQTFYHIGRRGDLQFATPRKFDAFGRIPEAAVFVTDQTHIGHWRAYIGRMEKTVYLYEVELPENYRLGEGQDGAENGDFKIITDEPVRLHFIQELVPGASYRHCPGNRRRW